MEVTLILDIYEKQYADLNRRFVVTLLEKENLIKEQERILLQIGRLENEIFDLKKQLNLNKDQDE